MNDLHQKRKVGVLRGMGLSTGIGMGTAYRVEPLIPAFYRIQIGPEEVEPELERFRRALEKSRDQLIRVKEKFEAEVGKEHSYIIDAHLFMLEDRPFLDGIEKRIREALHGPERAVLEEAERWLAIYRSLEDPFFQERGSDFQEVVDRLVANLAELDTAHPETSPEDVILVAPEITLAVLANYQLDRLRGIVLARGGRTSHAAIVARSCRIPVVSGVERVEELIRTGDSLIVDGGEGLVCVNPAPEQLRHYALRMEREKERALKQRESWMPSRTRDGRPIRLYANTEVGGEVPAALRLGAEGIGLFRTEYLYMKSREGPAGEEEQFEIYRDLAESLGERPAVIRTLDIGEERHPYFARLVGESETGLGLRGIRLSLEYPEIFLSQVRAILRARAWGDLRILLPMVSSLDEVLAARRLIEEARAGLEARGEDAGGPPQVGIVLEVPAAIFCLEALARQADFLAVGTNDLIQYTLAADRSSERTATLFNPLHPAILSSLQRVSQIAAREEKITFVCGEIAAQPVYASLLIGLGFQHLSMNPFAIPDIKNVVEEISWAEAREAVERLLQLSTVAEIQGFVDQIFGHWEALRDRAS